MNFRNIFFSINHENDNVTPKTPSKSMTVANESGRINCAVLRRVFFFVFGFFFVYRRRQRSRRDAKAQQPSRNKMENKQKNISNIKDPFVPIKRGKKNDAKWRPAFPIGRFFSRRTIDCNLDELKKKLNSKSAKPFTHTESEKKNQKKRRRNERLQLFKVRLTFKTRGRKKKPGKNQVRSNKTRWNKKKMNKITE